MYDVVIPWRTDNGPRERIFEWVIERWEMRCPGANLIIADVEGERFSRSASRNAGAAKSKSDVLVFADADTPPIPAFLDIAVARAAQGDWCLPFGANEYYNLNQARTEVYLAQSPSTDILRPASSDVEHRLTAWAGMLAVPREAFDKVGGYDERFVGWGHEDVAFRLALDNEWGPHQRVDDGYVLHLWHPREAATFGTLEELENRRIFDQDYRRKYRWRDERHR